MSNHFSSYKNLFKIASKGRVLLAFLPMGLMATGLPSGHVIKHGQATITQTPTETKIEQSTTGALIEWDKFSVPSGHSVVVDMPGIDVTTQGTYFWATVNRVVGNEKSTIAGKIISPATFVLTNPNGILIEATGNIKVGGRLFLSGYDVRTVDFDSQGTFRDEYTQVAEFGKMLGNKNLEPMNNSVINLGELAAEYSINIFGANLRAESGSLFQAPTITFDTSFSNLSRTLVGSYFASSEQCSSCLNENRTYTIDTHAEAKFVGANAIFANRFRPGEDLTQTLGGGDLEPQERSVSNISGIFTTQFQEPRITIEANAGLIDNITIKHDGIPGNTTLIISGLDGRTPTPKPPTVKLKVGSNMDFERVSQVYMDSPNVYIGNKENGVGRIIRAAEEMFYAAGSYSGENKNKILFVDPNFFSKNVFQKSPKAVVTFKEDTFWDTGGTTKIEPILNFEGPRGLDYSYANTHLFMGGTLLELEKGLDLGGNFVFSGNSRIKLLENAKAYESTYGESDKMEVPIVRTKEEWETLSITEPNVISGGHDFHHQIIVGDNIDFGGETIETKEIENQQKKFEIHGLGNKLSNFVVGGGGLFGENENRTDVNNLKIDGKVIAKNPGQSGVGILHSKVGYLSLVETDIKSNVIVEVDNQNPQKHAYIGGVVGAIPKNGLGLSLNNSINTTIRVLNKTKGNYEKNSGWDEIKTPLEKLGDPSSTKEEKETAIEKITQFSDGLSVGRVASIENIGGIAGYITEVETSSVFNNNTLVNANISVDRDGGIQKRMTIRELSKSAIESIHKQKKGGATVEGLPEDITSLEQKIEKIITATDLGTNGDKVGGMYGEASSKRNLSSPSQKVLLKGRVEGEQNVGGMVGLYHLNYGSSGRTETFKSEQHIIGHVANVGGFAGKAPVKQEFLGNNISHIPNFYFTGEINSPNASFVGGQFGLTNIKYPSSDVRQGVLISGVVTGRDHVGAVQGKNSWEGSTGYTTMMLSGYSNARVYATKHTAHTYGALSVKYRSTGFHFDGFIGAGDPTTVYSNTAVNIDKNPNTTLLGNEHEKAYYLLTEKEISKLGKRGGDNYLYTIRESMSVEGHPFVLKTKRDPFLGDMPQYLEAKEIVSDYIPSTPIDICTVSPDLCKPRVDSISEDTALSGQTTNPPSGGNHGGGGSSGSNHTGGSTGGTSGGGGTPGASGSGSGSQGDSGGSGTTTPPNTQGNGAQGGTTDTATSEKMQALESEIHSLKELIRQLNERLAQTPPTQPPATTPNQGNTTNQESTRALEQQMKKLEEVIRQQSEALKQQAEKLGKLNTTVPSLPPIIIQESQTSKTTLEIIHKILKSQETLIKQQSEIISGKGKGELQGELIKKIGELEEKIKRLGKAGATPNEVARYAIGEIEGISYQWWVYFKSATQSKGGDSIKRSANAINIEQLL